MLVLWQVSVAENWVLFLIAQIVLCIVFSVRIGKMSPNVAKALYLGYTLLTGATFGGLFIAYEMSSIIFIFLATSIILGVFALIGYRTNVDLNKMGTYLLMGLLAIIILEIINIFLANSSLDIGLCILGIIIFIGYIAFDMQRIKHFATSESENLAVLGAFELYLDFINIFLDLLRLFGNSRD